VDLTTTHKAHCALCHFKKQLGALKHGAFQKAFLPIHFKKEGNMIFIAMEMTDTYLGKIK